jgi:hypothetical protein
MATTDFGDCIMIASRFERAASWAPTEEAVFAVAGLALDGMRTQATAFVNQQESSQALTTTSSAQTSGGGQALAPNATALSLTGNESQGANLKNLDKANEEDEGFFQKIATNFYPGGDVNDLGGIFNSECIPCGFRLDHMGNLIAEAFVSPLGGLSEYLKLWEQAFTQFLNQIFQLLNLFNGLDQFVDLCALIKFLNDFVCIPDLQRILSALMALMNRTSFEFGGIMGLILQLVGPLLSPFLSNILAELQNYLLMIIRPLECIIDSIQAILAKLDYNILFQNIDSLEKHPPMKRRKEDPRDPIKVPFMDAYIERRDIVEGEGILDDNVISNTSRDLYNQGIDAMGGSAIKAENAEEQAAVEAAAAELKAVREAGRNVDASDANAVAQQRQREQAAQEKYNQAKDEKNLSKIGQVNKAIDTTVANVKSSLMLLIQKLREAANVVEGFFQALFDEFKKLIGEYVGGSGGLIGELLDKMALVQLISLISAIISAFGKGLNCDKEDEDIKVENFIPAQQGMTVWTDEEGNLHIEEDPARLGATLDTAVEEMVKAFGVDPTTSTPGAIKEADKGSGPESARQRLKSLVEFTGDPVLDTEIARATERLTTPISVVFKCPLQSTLEDAEKINQWISELG